MPQRAYAVLETDENTGSIYFAASARTARRYGANEYADGEIRYVECYRTPWADAYAETQKVPASIAIRHGWHFECAGCAARIDEDFICDHPSRAFDKIIGFVGTAVWCSPRCKSREESRQRARKKAQNAAIKMLRTLIRNRFPDAKIIDPGYAYAGYKAGRTHIIEDACVDFSFPGMKIGPASLRLRRPQNLIGPIHPQYYCCNGDKDAFENYADRTRPHSDANP